MRDLVRLEFSVQPLEGTSGPASIVPLLDGISLLKLVAEFELSKGFKPAGGYAGLVPEHFNFGPLDCYFLGKSIGGHFEKAGYYLLGCSCEEAGCWPFAARISSSENLVVWSEFKQLHRPNWDYSAFGPFTFDAEQYKSAISSLVATLNERNSA